MKATIEVKDSEEARRIRSALADPVFRAVANMIGVLQSLPDDKAKRKVLRHVAEELDIPVR